MRHCVLLSVGKAHHKFPFLFGGTFIEAVLRGSSLFPLHLFPFLFGGTFIEAALLALTDFYAGVFPFLFGGTFIEARFQKTLEDVREDNFPSFSEGLSLRQRF